MKNGTSTPLRLLNPKQAADVLGVSRWKVYDLVYSRKIAHTKVGKLIRFTLDDLQRFADENRVSAES